MFPITLSISISFFSVTPAFHQGLLKLDSLSCPLEVQCQSAAHLCDKMPEIMNSIRMKVYFGSRFGNSHPWLFGAVALGPAVKQSTVEVSVWWERAAHLTDPNRQSEEE